MNESISLGRLFGIEIKLHWSMPVLLLVFLFAIQGSMGIGLFGAAMLLLSLEAIVLLHELGHSLVAKSYGLQVIDITFWPLGGMARMSRIPENTRIEATIALAGPAVNFVLAGIAMPIAWLAGGTEFGALTGTFALMNLVLGGFNLLPAFPMDGGRVLRALLARKGDWLRATEQAVRVGRWMALLMLLFGVFTSASFMLVFVAGFVWISGQKELMAIRMRHTGSPFDLRGMQDAVRRAGGGGGGPLAGPGIPFGADPREAEGLDNAAHDGQARRPHGDSSQPQQEQQGWSDEDIADLEGYHGRLRNFHDDE